MNTNNCPSLFSNSELNSLYKTAPQYPLEHRSNKFECVISSLLESKIRYLMQKFPNTEWSGVLFFTPTGTIEKGDFKVVCDDLLLLDIGTSTYTEYEMNADIATYMAMNGLLECKIGMAHSHHSMPTFFSGTDMSTLRDEGMKRNHFLSLIVNCDGNYNAKITRKSEGEERIERVYSYKTFGDEELEGKLKYSKNKVKVLEEFDLTISKKQIIDIDTTEIDNKIIEIQNNKASQITTHTYTPTTTTYTSTNIDDDNIALDILQELISGDIFAHYTSKFGQLAVLRSLDNRVKNRFGCDINNYIEWIDGYIQTLLDEADCYNVDLVSTVKDILTELHNLMTCFEVRTVIDYQPSRKYLNVIKESLGDYLEILIDDKYQNSKDINKRANIDDLEDSLNNDSYTDIDYFNNNNFYTDI